LPHGIDDVDIGCLQVNWHWHGLVFTSPAAALTPGANAQYAASLLRKYRVQTGTWSGAVGRYHSHDARRAEVYRCRIVMRSRQPKKFAYALMLYVAARSNVLYIAAKCASLH
jgi:hypothetical protein